MDRLDEKILEAYRESILNERKKKFDLGSGHMGHGIVVWNRAKEVHGDYEKVAHIDDKRQIKWYIKNPPKEVKDYVEKIAKGKNPSVSTSQRDRKVFREGLDEQKLVFKGHHLKDNLLDEITLEELFDTVGHNIPKEKIDARSMMKEFESILKTKVSDARFMAKKVIPEMVKELKKGE
jgi:hypothetical protein